MLKRLSLTAMALTASAAPALAHLDPVEHGSLLAGISHPFTGLDHMLAMMAVGLWAALLGGRATRFVPTAFVGTMVFGFAAALSGIRLPFVEPVIGASVVIVGLFAMAALKVRTDVGMALVGFFALFHGYAHGGELGEAGALWFGAGFVLATALLHAAGIGFGWLTGGRRGHSLARAAGALTALGGLWIVAGY